MPATTAVYTLGDLLDEPDLGVELVVGGERARSLPISGAHSIEVEHPSRWLDRDWLVLTTGVRLRRNARAQRDPAPDPVPGRDRRRLPGHPER